MAKTYAGTYLYTQYSEYEKQIFSFMMSGEEIDKDTSDFDDIKYEVKKRQVSNSLVKVLESEVDYEKYCLSGKEEVIYDCH